MSFLRLIALAGLAGLVASCTSTGSIRQPTGPETIPSEKALVLPPPGGPSIVSVIEQKRGNGVEQSISLFTSSSVAGQNFLKVQFLGASGANPATGNASYRMVNETGIAREIAASVPGVRMARSATFLQNSYGPFGYASGKSHAGDTCLYAWQQVRSSRSDQTQARNFGMIQIRLRLCDARATERQLLGVMYGYTVIGTFNGEIWNPYGMTRGVDPTLGQTGSPIYPDEGGYRSSPMPIGYEPAQTPTAVRPTVMRRAAAPTSAAPPALPQAIGPRVPDPETSENTQYTPAAAPISANAPQQPVQQQVQQQAMSNGGVTVPSPDCIGNATMTAACHR